MTAPAQSTRATALYERIWEAISDAHLKAAGIAVREVAGRDGGRA
jgi:hypothetical protein